MNTQQRQLQIGVLGAGPIAQFAHFEALNKAGNAALYAICDVAEDLLARVGPLCTAPRTRSPVTRRCSPIPLSMRS